MGAHNEDRQPPARPRAEGTERVRVVGQALAFRCTECGDCCRDWSVGTDLAFRETLADRLARHAPQETLADYVQPPVDDGVQAQPVLRTRAGACVFLGAGQRCGLHEAFGPSAKPHACQLYPYRQVRLARTNTISLDLSCVAAAEMLAHPFPASWIEYQRSTPDASTVVAELIAGLPLVGADLLELESTLLAILGRDRQPLDHRLLAGSLFLDDVLADLDDDVAGAQPSSATLAASRRDRPGLVDTLIRRARATTAEPNRGLGVLGQLVDLIEEWLAAFDIDDAGDTWERTRRLIDRFALQETGDESAPSARILARTWANRSDTADDVFANYCWHLLGGRQLTVEHGVLGGYRVLIVHMAMARLHAADLALAESAPMTAEHAIRAVQTVERNFGHLPLLQRFWKRTSMVNLLTAPALAARLLLLPTPAGARQPAVRAA